MVARLALALRLLAAPWARAAVLDDYAREQRAVEAIAEGEAPPGIGEPIEGAIGDAIRAQRCVEWAIGRGFTEEQAEAACAQ
jgi:hypothetical protein